MEDKDLIKKLKELKKTSVKKGFLASLQSDLKKYMEFYPIREGIEIKSPEISLFFGMPILRIMAVALIAILILGGGGAVFASQKSLPGDILYSVKIITENFQETFTFNPQKKAQLKTILAEKRIKEMKDILEKKDIKMERFTIAEKRLEKNIVDVRQFVEKELAEGKDNELTKEITDKLNNIEKETKEYKNEIDLIKKTEEERLKKKENNNSSDLNNKGKKKE
ncbi:MAG: DUF5667 domain-containing protein [Candidatus Paceibacterota bacterium]